MRTLRYALVVTLLFACASPYYNVMEQLGFPKRDILVDRVEEARDSQEQAADRFKDALEKFIAPGLAQRARKRFLTGDRLHPVPKSQLDHCLKFMAGLDMSCTVILYRGKSQPV